MGYADELFDLSGRVVLITGGSRGLGREMAFAAARCGADLVIAGRNYESCVATAAEIEQETGRVALPYSVHVGRWGQLDGLVEAAYARFGRIDVLINNAGMQPVYDSLNTVTEKLFDSVVNLNLKGPFRLSVLVGDRMMAAGGGSIINVSSSGSIRPRPSIVPYAAAKAGRHRARGQSVRCPRAATSGASRRDRRCRVVSRFGRVQFHDRGNVALRRWHALTGIRA